MSSVVLDNSSSTGAPNSSTLTANGARLGSGGLSATGAGSFANSFTLVGQPNIFNSAGAPSAPNELLLNGAYLRINGGTITAPETAPSTATLQVIDSGTSPQLQLFMTSTAPLFPAGDFVFTAGPTVNTTAANSLMLAKLPYNFLPSYPVGSVATHTQVAAADAIACPTITATSQVRIWLAGLTGVVGATAVLAGTASAITAGTGFTLNGTIGAIYGYEVLYG